MKTLYSVRRILGSAAYCRPRGDIAILACTLGMAAFGCIMIYSASSYVAEVQYGDPFYFVEKQLVGVVFGTVAMFAAAMFPYGRLIKLKIPLAVLSVALLALVFVPGVGVTNYGATRWIGVGPVTIQPSEIAKYAFVLFAAAHFSKNYRRARSIRGVLPVLAFGIVICLLIIAEPNMSITMCMAALMAVMLFLSGVRIKHFLLLLCPLVAAVPLLIVAEPYRLQRLLAFLDPWASPKDEGYQLIQSLYALGRGGFFGVGLFNGRQKYLFLPFAESDFILSVIGEETGLIGCLAVFLLYFVVIFRGIRIAANCRDKFRCYLAAGITAVIAVQSLLNFAVVTGSIPPTGLPLPFISYGGTSLVVFLSAAGILLNLSAEIKSREGLVWIT